MKSAEQSQSLWESTGEQPQFPALAENVRCEVCVVGGGIAGVTAAYLLAGEGKQVVLLSDSALGGGETGQTSAHLSSALDERYLHLERMHGAQGARLAYQSHAAAIARIESIVRDEQIECGFARTDGYLVLGPEHDAEYLDRERDAALRAGFAGVERLARAPLTDWDSGPCLRFPEQAVFHPLRYLAGLARAAERRGVRFHTGTHVAESPTGGSPIRIVTSGGYTVTADAAVIATNSPVSYWVTVNIKQAPYRTFVIGGQLPAGSVPPVLLWDTASPYRYVRVAGGDNGHDVLLVGGEDHKTGQADDADDRFARLEAWARARYPMLGDITHRWSGQVMEPADGLAFIGPEPGDRNLYVITGDSGHGLTHGTLGAVLVTDLIAGRDNEWLSLYDPSRTTLSAPLTLSRENLNVAAQYADYLKPGEAESEEAIPRGSGAVLKEGLEPVAAFCDAQGTVHRFAAACTHLGCVVHWNSLERSWDCPCHGSRFAADTGEVLNGPAVKGLKRV